MILESDHVLLQISLTMSLQVQTQKVVIPHMHAFEPHFSGAML